MKATLKETRNLLDSNGSCPTCKKSFALHKDGHRTIYCSKKCYISRPPKFNVSAALELWSKGASVNQIANQIDGASVGAVYRWLKGLSLFEKRYNHAKYKKIKKKPKILYEIILKEQENILALWGKGFSVWKISRHLKLNAGTITKWLKQLGVYEPRGRKTSKPRGHSNNYRRKAFKAYGSSCFNCGYNKYKEVLEIHHLDNNHSNNDIDNLRPCCPTCHVELHFLTKTGKWRNRKNIILEVPQSRV